MDLHKNSQKRLYTPDALYFITTNTKDRYPFFSEDIFCELFLSELFTSIEIKKFDLPGYKINPDHVHLLIKPGSDYNYSEIIRNMKRTSSLHINQMIKGCPDTACEGNESVKKGCGWDDENAYNENSDIECAYNESANIYARLHYTQTSSYIHHQHVNFNRKYGKSNPFPKFKWHKSFHDHIIRDERDLQNHLNYIKIQWTKHDLEENKWCYTDG